MVKLLEIKDYFVTRVNNLSMEDEFFLFEYMLEKNKVKKFFVESELDKLVPYDSYKKIEKLRLLIQFRTLSELTCLEVNQLIFDLYYQLKSYNMNKIIKKILELQENQKIIPPMEFVKVYYKLSNGDIDELESILGSFSKEEPFKCLEKAFEDSGSSADKMYRRLVVKLYTMGYYNLESIQVLPESFFSQSEIEIVMSILKKRGEVA